MLDGHVPLLGGGSGCLPSLSPTTQRQTSPGRNPCPCGSGKKYKRCCLA
ncbi:MAG: SEC-C metal-binding domain-containing protein [Myxococcota bacterium]